MPCPDNAGKHPYHDHRWIATADAKVERGHDPRSWGLESGELICQMRDGTPANARLIAAAPELLALVRAWLLTDPHGTHSAACRAAIAKAEGREVAP
jgi:hypothetical protein